MAAYPCSVRNPFSWVAALCSLLVFFHSISFGFLTILLTSLTFILYPVIISHFKTYQQKSTTREELLGLSTEEVPSESSLQDKSSALSHTLGKEVFEVLTVPTQKKAQHQSIEKNSTKVAEEVLELRVQQNEEETGGQYLLSSSEVLLSDSESQDQTMSSDDYSENESLFRENPNSSTNYSDGSISDEESLIEIALPTGHYVEQKRSHEQSWYGFQQKWESCFRHQNWMDISSEMNEENFIEFDICMGSIKCSRFQIQA